MSRLSDKVFLYWVYELQPGLTSAILEHNLNYKTLEYESLKCVKICSQSLEKLLKIDQSTFKKTF